MILRVEWSLQAKKTARRVPPVEFERIVQAIRRHAETGLGDVVRLQGRANEYRLRVGGWRVLFLLDFASAEMTIKAVLPRGGAYQP